MTQVSEFSEGGYVVHKIEGFWKGRVSMWINSHGVVVDAEQVVGWDQPPRHVNPDGKLFREARVKAFRAIALHQAAKRSIILEKPMGCTGWESA